MNGWSVLGLLILLAIAIVTICYATDQPISGTSDGTSDVFSVSIDASIPFVAEVGR